MTESAMQPWTKERMIHLLDQSELALAKALTSLYARQTTDEQSDNTTRHRNGRGFGARDAEFLSDIARKLPRYSNRMTPRQIAKVRPMVKRYWRQLLEEAELAGKPVIWPGSREERASIDKGTQGGTSRTPAMSDPGMDGAWA